MGCAAGECGACVVMNCVPRVCEDGVITVELICATGMQEDGVIRVELGCATGMCEDGVIRVELGCVTGVGVDGVIALPSPREYDPNTAADVGTLAAFCFSAAVFPFLEGASGFGFTTTAFQMRVFVFIVTCSTIFRGPLMFFPF